MCVHLICVHLIMSDTTERLHFHFSLSCTGEGKGNPLQCSCLENPRDGGAWWAAVCGVAQSRTRLKWLSSNHVNKLHKVHTINSYIPDYLNIYNTQDTLSIRSIKMRVKRTMSRSCSVCFWGCPGRGPRRGMLKGSGSPCNRWPKGLHFICSINWASKFPS